jgi:4-hydroxy-tetrahydrodipicolinate reductase
MKIALIGYGKMGKAVERIALEQGFEIVLAGGSSNATLDISVLKSCDVAIEFTRPDAAVHNLMTCLQHGVPVVTGTTGWQDQYETVKQAFLEHNGSLFTASNFSIGMNFAFELNKQLAQWLSKYPSYQPAIHEVHHLQKIDKPSGTAVTLANDIITQNTHISNWQISENKEQVANQILPIHSERLEGVVGIHQVQWTSPIDRISIGHEAFNRDGFAIGALNAAEWIMGKHGVFGMSDMLFGSK